MLKFVFKFIEYIRIKNRLTIFKFWEPTWGEGGGGPAELVKRHFF